MKISNKFAKSKIIKILLKLKWIEIKKMRYKIVITFQELKTAKKIHKLLQKSEVYNSTEIMELDPIRELCDKCAKRS